MAIFPVAGVGVVGVNVVTCVVDNAEGLAAADDGIAFVVDVVAVTLAGAAVGKLLFVAIALEPFSN